jgi:4-hydroxybenzoate polyprenyltransferase
LASFLGFAKRRGEILAEANSGNTGDTRKVLDHYSPEMLDNFLLITATGAVMSYAIYAASEYAYEKFGTHNLIYTTIFVIYGVFRYYYLIHQKDKGSSPTEVLYSDYPMIINLVIWIAACIWIIGV